MMPRTSADLSTDIAREIPYTYVEVTFTNGEKQTKTATIEYEGTKMLIDTTK